MLEDMTSPRSARSPAQADAARANGSKGRGPATPDGRARSAQNPLDHGLRSEELTVLPHERPEEVLQHVERVLGDLGVVGYTETLVGKRVALRLLQQRRLEEIEAHRLRAEVDRRLDDTDEMNAVRLIEGTITALQTMATVMSSSFPDGREALDRLLVPVSAVSAMLEQVEASGTKVFVGCAALTAALGRLRQGSPVETDAAAYAVVVERALVALGAVERLLPGARAAAEARRVEVASQMPLPDDRDTLLRRRYAADLDRRLATDMRLLAALREQREAQSGSGSLGQPPQVQVRLVR